MPRICSFLGISIWINYKDHMPPHFHAKYGREKGSPEVLLTIPFLATHRGFLPPAQMAEVRAWAMQHIPELEQNWELARAHQPLLPIDPPQR